MRNLTLGMMGMIAASALAAPAYAAPNLVRNGDFEMGLASWTEIPGPEVDAATGAQYQAGAGATGSPASLANTFAAFGGGDQSNFSTLISNPFDTVAGQVYRLTFSFAQFGGAPGAQTLNYRVFSQGLSTIAGTVQQAGGTDLDTIFTERSFLFTGSGSGTGVAFSISGSPTGSVDGLLDNVSISAVPEPATWGMMILGLGVVGGVMRRRGAKLTAVTAAR